MKQQQKLRKPLLAAVLAVFAASAWAAYEHNSSYVPEIAVSENAGGPTQTPEAMALSPNETVVATEAPASSEPSTATEAAPAPKTEMPAAVAQVPVEPAITIEKPRLTPDQRIQAEVMEILAANPTLSGKIGVVSEDRVVTLTGYTLTSGQAWRAGRDAGRVQGVRHVVNEIRPRVGGITS
jgi:hypothetical protein